MLHLFHAVELAIIYDMSLHGTVQRADFNSCVSSYRFQANCLRIRLRRPVMDYLKVAYICESDMMDEKHQENIISRTS